MGSSGTRHTDRNFNSEAPPMRLTLRSSSMSNSLSVGTPGLEATASRSRARSSVVMPAEASALGIALRRVGDDLAVVRLRRQRYSPRKP
jgi:hypothetical protein